MNWNEIIILFQFEGPLNYLIAANFFRISHLEKNEMTGDELNKNR